MDPDSIPHGHDICCPFPSIPSFRPVLTWLAGCSSVIALANLPERSLGAVRHPPIGNRQNSGDHPTEEPRLQPFPPLRTGQTSNWS